jgi:hypothetical protein
MVSLTVAVALAFDYQRPPMDTVYSWDMVSVLRFVVAAAAVGVSAEQIQDMTLEK